MIFKFSLTHIDKDVSTRYNSFFFFDTVLWPKLAHTVDTHMSLDTTRTRCGVQKSTHSFSLSFPILPSNIFLQTYQSTHSRKNITSWAPFSIQHTATSKATQSYHLYYHPRNPPTWHRRSPGNYASSARVWSAFVRFFTRSQWEKSGMSILMGSAMRG